MRILGIAGSLRRASYNRALISEAEEGTAESAEIDVHLAVGCASNKRSVSFENSTHSP